VLTICNLNFRVYLFLYFYIIKVLYIPPYWMVRTETDVGAMGVDILSPSQEQLLLLEASVQLVPLHRYEESRESRIIAAQVSSILFR
jgi:hypothetical protein